MIQLEKKILLLGAIATLFTLAPLARAQEVVSATPTLLLRAESTTQFAVVMVVLFLFVCPWAFQAIREAFGAREPRPDPLAEPRVALLRKRGEALRDTIPHGEEDIVMPGDAYERRLEQAHHAG